MVLSSARIVYFSFRSLGGPDWGNIPPLEDEIIEFLETNNLKSLSVASAGSSAQVPEATPPMAVRQPGIRAASGLRQEPSQPPPQFMKRGSSGAGPVSPAAAALGTPGRTPAGGDVSERRRSIQMTAGSLAVRV